MSDMTSNEMSSPGTARATLTVDETAKVLGISRAIAYRSAREYLATNGEKGLPVIQIGRRLLVPMHQLDALLAGQLKP